MPMNFCESKQAIDLQALAAQINYEGETLAGSIEHQTIQNLPLNGRAFVQLATVYAGATSACYAPVELTIIGGAAGAQERS